jgi:hypothetical protein
MYTSIKIKSEKYDTERCKIDIPNTQIHLSSWLGTGTSMKGGGVKLVGLRRKLYILWLNLKRCLFHWAPNDVHRAMYTAKRAKVHHIFVRLNT